MDKIDKDSSSSSGVTFGECNIWCLLFADDLAFLSSNKSDLQHALDRFSDTCLDAGIKISTAKTEIMCLSRTLSSVLSKQIKQLFSRRRSLSILEAHSRVMVDRKTNWTHALEKQVSNVSALPISFIFLFYLYIYRPDSQESDGGANK